MIERNLVPASEFWAAQPITERFKMLDALKVDTAMATHDFAGLPPELWAAIAAGLTPPSSGGRPPHEEEAEAEETHGRRKR